ncbi:MAG: hypothetical protein HYU70_14515 [Bacteroidetes bacterium]|nr:hypothetical protein [Bacteroidota bacterium]
MNCISRIYLPLPVTVCLQSVSGNRLLLIHRLPLLIDLPVTRLTKSIHH